MGFFFVILIPSSNNMLSFINIAGGHPNGKKIFFAISIFAIIEKIPSSHCAILRCNYQEKYLFTLLISLDMSRLCNKTQWMPHIPSAGSICPFWVQIG